MIWYLHDLNVVLETMGTIRHGAVLHSYEKNSTYFISVFQHISHPFKSVLYDFYIIIYCKLFLCSCTLFIHSFYSSLPFSLILFISAFGQMIKPIIDSMTVTPAGGSSVVNRTQTTTTQASTSTATRSTSGPQNPESIFEPRESCHTALANSSSNEARIPAPEIFQAKDVKKDIKIIKEAYKDHSNEGNVNTVLNNMENLIIKGKKVTIKEDNMSCLGRLHMNHCHCASSTMLGGGVCEGDTPIS